jgi:hypothetical protein
MIYNKVTYEIYNLAKGVVLMLAVIVAYEVDAV